MLVIRYKQMLLMRNIKNFMKHIKKEYAIYVIGLLMMWMK